MAKRPFSFRGSSLAQAIQGNFDHLMGSLRELMRGHNLVVDDIEGLADQGTAHTEELGQHEDRITAVETDLTTAEADIIVIRGEGRRKPAAIYPDEPDIAWLPPKGDKGDAGVTPQAAPPWPGEDGAEGFFMPPGSSDTATGSSGVDVEDDTVPVTTATTIDFGDGITVTDDGSGHITVDGLTQVHDHSTSLEGGDFIDADQVYAESWLQTLGTFVIDGEDSPTWAADQNDYAPAAESSFLQPTLSAAVALNGLHTDNIVAGKFHRNQIGRVMLVVNDDTVNVDDLTIAHEAAGSSTRYQFSFDDATDLVMTPGSMALFVYSPSLKWKLQGFSGASAGAAGADGADGTNGRDGVAVPWPGEDGTEGFFMPGRKALSVKEDGTLLNSNIETVNFAHGLDVTTGSNEAGVTVDESELDHSQLAGRTVTSAHPASAVDFTPYSTIASTDVQSAIQELLDESGGGGGGGASTKPSPPALYDDHQDFGELFQPVPPARDELHILNWSTKKIYGPGSASDRYYLPYACSIVEVYFVLPAVTTRTATVDVKKNGTSIFGTKPTTSSAMLSSRGVMSTTALTRDDYLTFVVDSPGSTAGRLKVFVVLRRLA
jgi:hypothetical protein